MLRCGRIELEPRVLAPAARRAPLPLRDWLCHHAGNDARGVIDQHPNDGSKVPPLRHTPAIVDAHRTAPSPRSSAVR